jgi:putative effector of murein hydrolase LrgA (UPF0299 family)
MLRGLFLLLVCQLVGEVVARGLDLPAPGPVIGLALLALGLALHARRGGAVEGSEVERAATALLGVLSLMFVPAGVGVVQYFDLLAAQGLALGVALVVSTTLTLLATVGVFLAIKRRTA